MGNAALAGAAALALRGGTADALAVADKCTYIELSGRPDFADAFAENIPLGPVQWR